MSYLDQLANLINLNALGIDELKEMGCNSTQIYKYTLRRQHIWNTACGIFTRMFSHMGQFHILKEYNDQRQTMCVKIYRKEDNLANHLMVEDYHRDPVCALVECAKRMGNEDDFLLALFNELKL